MSQGESLFIESAVSKLEQHGIDQLIKKKDEQIALLDEEVERLKEIILGLKRQAFGPKKERWESQEQSVLIFNEVECEAKKPSDSDEEEETTQVKGFERKRGKRKPLPQNLPRKVVTISLPAEEQFATDGTALKVIGKEISEKLIYEPAKIEVIEYHRLRYGVEVGDPVKTAPPVPSIIPKGIPTPSLLAGIIIHKYSDGLPLYRQEEMFGRVGVDLSRGSMARWIIRCSEACMPIWNVLEERLFSSNYVSCDETRLQVLKENGRKSESQSWMWVRATPNDDKKIVLFDYDPHRSGEVAKRLLAEVRGHLQADGLSTYDCLESIEGMTRIGCNMHGRRKFEEAFKHGSTTGKSLAEKGLKYYQRLYSVEEEIKRKGMNWSERFEYRNLHAVPIWLEFKQWAEDQTLKVPPKSKLGGAYHYFLEQHEYLRGYLIDGKLEMDNGFAERAIRKFAIGRNNWLFSDSEDGANASALFYSFVVTAKLNGINAYEALRQIFEQVPMANTIDDYEKLANLLLSQPLPH